MTPGKGGRRHFSLPVFDTVAEAMRETNANASLVFVPAPQAGAAMIEAVEAGVPLVVCVTERVPLLDMLRVRQALAGSATKLVGPNSQGVLSPGKCKVGVMSTADARPGSIGIVSRSASLTSEIVAQTSAAGLGQSTTVGIGGDPIHGIGFVDCLRLFLDDPETQGVILIGEIGGNEEEAAADFLSPDEAGKARGGAGGRPPCTARAAHGPCRRLRPGRARACRRQDRGAARRRGADRGNGRPGGGDDAAGAARQRRLRSSPSPQALVNRPGPAAAIRKAA